MKMKICEPSGDSIIIEASNIKEIRKIAKKEVEKRGWKDCWSEKLEEKESL